MTTSKSRASYPKLWLVCCPIAMHAACSASERISFRQINRKTGNRLRQQLLDEETREPVDGYEKERVNLVAVPSSSHGRVSQAGLSRRSQFATCRPKRFIP
jgi:hypothetical protein